MSLIKHLTNGSQDPSFQIAKIAEESCYLRSSDLLCANGRSVPRQFKGKLGEYKQNIKMLTGIDVNIDLNGAVEHDQTRYFKAIIGNKTKVCPKCIEDSNCPIEHRFIFSTHCSKHNCRLQSSCACGHLFEWDQALLNGSCSSCGDVIQIISEDESAHQNYINSIDLMQKADVIWDLCLTASYVLRPSDSTPELIHFDSLPSTAELFEKAFQLLTLKDTAARWLAHLLHKREHYKNNLGDYAVFAPFYELISQLKCDWEILTIDVTQMNFDHSQTEFSEFTNKFLAYRPRWKKYGLTEEEQNSLAHDKVNLESISRVIGLPIQQVLTAPSLLGLSSLNGVKRSGNQFHRLSELNELCEKYNVKNQNQIYLKATQLDHYTGSFMANGIDVINWTFTNEVDGYFENGDNSLYKRLYVRRFQIYKKLIGNLYKKKGEKISEQEVNDIFKLSTKEIKDLNKHTMLFPAKWQQSKTAYYLMQDLLDIEKQHFNLRRYCYLRNLNFVEIKGKLDNLKIKPLYGDALYQCRYQVLFALKYDKLTKAQANSKKSEHPVSNPLWFSLGIKHFR